ncbi:MAG: ATP synthase F1 subunit delta [Myxococcales bacterium]|nr:ATP synthase F1 subunit delta [Myxococcales bacterium]
MIPGILARRYARALIELADSPTARDTYGRDLASFAAATRASDGLGSTVGSILSTERYPESQRKALVRSLCERMRLDPTVRKFLDYVFDRGRIAGVEQMSRFYAEMADELARRVHVEVTSARPLTTVSTGKIHNALERATGRSVVMETAVDPELIGGIVARVAGTVIDGSVRKSLQNLRTALRGE